MRVIWGVGRALAGVRVAAAAAAFAAAVLGGRAAGAVTFTDPAAGVTIDLALPPARVCVFAPATLRGPAGCEGLDADAVAARMPADAAVAALVREGGVARVLVVQTRPGLDRPAFNEDAADLVRGLVEGVVQEGGRPLGDAGAALAPDALTVERGVQVVRHTLVYGAADGDAALVQATALGRHAFVTVMLMTTAADAAPARAMLDRLMAHATVTPFAGEVAWRPLPAAPTGPVRFRDAAHGIAFDAQFPGARVCVVHPASMRSEAGCADVTDAMAAQLRQPDMLFVARVADALGSRVLTVKAVARDPNSQFFVEDADEFASGFRRGLARDGHGLAGDAGVRAVRAVAGGVQVVRDAVELSAPGDAGDEGRAVVVASFVGREWVLSTALVTIAGDVARSTADLDRVVRSAEVTPPSGVHAWETRPAAAGRHAAGVVIALLKVIAVCVAVVLVVRSVARRRRG
jgi:hypothetical protein